MSHYHSLDRGAEEKEEKRERERERNGEREEREGARNTGEWVELSTAYRSAAIENTKAKRRRL